MDAWPYIFGLGFKVGTLVIYVQRVNFSFHGKMLGFQTRWLKKIFWQRLIWVNIPAHALHGSSMIPSVRAIEVKRAFQP